MNISICICTYNRSSSLNTTLESLVFCANELHAGDEIVVIDNNSSDQTQKIVNSFATKLPLEYAFEHKQGLSAARNKALSEFKNEYIVFIDDDITIRKGFINAYRHAFITYPSHHFFGGKIDVDWSGKTPYWYKSTNLPMINGLIGYYDLGESDQPLTKQQRLPYGANFALTRQAVQKVGVFDPNLGVKGKQFGRGEESDYFNRVLENNFDGVYIANAKVYHRFQTQRMTIPYLYRYGIQKGIAAVLLDDLKQDKVVSRIVHQICAGFYQLIKFRVDRFYQCVINIGVLRGALLTQRSMRRNEDD